MLVLAKLCVDVCRMLLTWPEEKTFTSWSTSSNWYACYSTPSSSPDPMSGSPILHGQIGCDIDTLHFLQRKESEELEESYEST